MPLLFFFTTSDENPPVFQFISSRLNVSTCSAVTKPLPFERTAKADINALFEIIPNFFQLAMNRNNIFIFIIKILA